jgi:hypothetical protein
VGWALPFGSLWNDGFLAQGVCCFYERRTAGDYASSGPMFEVDLGARLSRSYNVFALWERALLGPGDLDPDAYGGQKYGTSDFFAAAVRFSTDADAFGFAMEIALGYRVFQAKWEDGTTLTMDDGFLDARIGLGADIRLTEWFALSPMITLSSGSFGEATWEGSREGSALGRFDERGQFGTAMFTVGGHFDVY